MPTHLYRVHQPRKQHTAVSRGSVLVVKRRQEKSTEAYGQSDYKYKEQFPKFY